NSGATGGLSTRDPAVLDKPAQPESAMRKFGGISAGMIVWALSASVLLAQNAPLRTSDGAVVAPQTFEQIRRRRGLDPQQLAKMPQADVAAVMRRLRYPDLPLRRIEFRAVQSHDFKNPQPPPVRASLRTPGQFRTLQQQATKVRAAGVPAGPPETLRGPLTAGLTPGGWE